MIRALLVLLVYAAAAHATITVTDRGTGTNNTSSTSIVITPASTITAANTGVIVLAMDNAAGGSSNLTATTLTDSVGNVWYVRADTAGGAANATQELVLLASRLTANFTSSDNLTITLTTASAAEAWTISEVVGSAGNGTIYVFSFLTSSTATGSPTITTSLQVNNGDVVFGAGAAESADTWTGDADSVNGTWSTKQSIGVGSGATGMSVISQYKVVTAYATQQYNPTLTSADAKLGWMVLTETDPKARAIFSSITAEATTTVPVSLPMGANSIGVLCVAADNGGSGGATLNFPTSFNDSKSNAWTLRQNAIFDPGLATAGAEMAIYTSVLTTGLAVGDTLAFTYLSANVGSKIAGVWEFAPTGGGVMSYVTGATEADGATGSPSITTTSIPSGDYVVGMVAAESENTFIGDADAINGSWKTQLSQGRDVALGAMSLTTQWKLTSATATQTYNPTLTSADTVMGWIEINESSSTLPGAFLQLFP